MAYVQNDLRLVTSDIKSGVAKLWFYTTATDNNATLIGAGYFSNGYHLGMRVGDIVDVVRTTGPQYARYIVTVANATTGAVTIAAPTAIA